MEGDGVVRLVKQDSMGLLFKLAWEYRGRLLIYLMVLVLATASEGFGLSMLLPILDTASGERGDSLFTQWAKDLFEFGGIEFSFFSLAGILFLALLAKYTLVMCSMHLSRAISAQATRDLREQAFRNIMDLPLAFFYRTRPGDLVATQFNSTAYAGAIFEYGANLLNGIFFCILYLTINSLISFRLTLIVLAVAGSSYFFILPRFRTGFRKGDEEKSVMDAVSSYLFDTLSGIKTVKAFSNAALHIKKYRDRIDRYRDLSVEIVDNRIVVFFFNEPLFVFLAIGLLVTSVGFLGIPFSNIVVFLLVLIQILPKVKLINNNWLAVQEYLPHLAKVRDVIDRNDKQYLSEGSIQIVSLEKNIRLDSVSFRYPQRRDNAITEISTIIEKGSTIAVVGPSGGGKTTFVDLLLRLHDPTEGSILVDGIPLQAIRPDDWRRLIGIVEQDPYLFNDTIANNIRYGKSEADEDEMVRAAKMAYAHEFIEECPEGYNSFVGNRGLKLSGGQKQRIALARALIREPELLVLDEATSALDSEFERLIQTAIRRLRGRMTIVVVAHRLSTVRDADKILVMEGGRIVESGNHDELMTLQGRYQELVNLQTGPGI